MWRSCGSSGGLCSEEVVAGSLDLLKSSYNLIVLRSGAPYDVKMKIYKIFRDLVDEINNYGRRNLGHELIDSEWLREPRLYKLVVRVRGRNIPRDAVIEVVGHNHYSEKESVSPGENIFKLAEGEYFIRLSIRGSAVAQKQVLLDSDQEVELVYQEPQRVSQKHRETRRYRNIIVYSGDPSIRVLYISIALIVASIVLQIIR